jgi:hypothetical protein
MLYYLRAGQKPAVVLFVVQVPDFAYSGNQVFLPQSKNKLSLK